MRKIAIIGAGQAGLQLGLSLLKNKYDVSIYTEHTPENILDTPAPGTSVMFADALEIERKLGIDFWQNTAPKIEKFHLSICLPNGKRLMSNIGQSLKPFQAIDQRLKFSVWMKTFAENGGNLIHQKVTKDDLEKIATDNDAVFVATGKDLISQIFETDTTRTIYEKPQRNLIVLIAKKQKEGKNFQMNTMNTNIFPVGGEVFIVPYLDKYNQKSVGILIEAQPNQELDVFKDLKKSDDIVKTVLHFFRKSLPWIVDSFEEIELIDSKSYAIGAIRPIVRKPYGYLPSGKIIFGLGDSIILNDPVAAQGSNTACRMAYHYYNEILTNKTQVFDANWINQTFEPFWENTAQYAQRINADFLKPRSFQLNVLVGYCKNSALFLDLMEGINNPQKMYQWIGSAKTVQQKMSAYGISKFSIFKGKIYLLRNILSYVLAKKLKFLS